MSRHFRITIDLEVFDQGRLAAAVESIAVPDNFESLEEWHGYRNMPSDDPVMADLKEWIPAPLDGVSQDLITCVEINENGEEIDL